MYHAPLAVQCIHGWSNEGGKDGDGKEGGEIPGECKREEIACLASYMQMTWFYVVSRRRT